MPLNDLSLLGVIQNVDSKKNFDLQSSILLTGVLGALHQTSGLIESN